MKKIVKTLLILLLVMFPLITISTIKADSGFDSSYGGSSGGGYSGGGYSGGGYSSGGFSGGGSSSYSYGGGGGISLVDLSGLVPIIIILAIIVLSGILVISYNTKHEIRYDFNEDYSDIPEDKLKEILPNLTLKYLKDVTYQRFIDIQMAWMEFDYKKLRELCTDELYNAYTTQLETLKLKNGQNIMSDFNLEQINIANIVEENGKVSITVYMRVRFKDYIINQKTKEVIRGTSSSYIVNNYVMTFVRGKDAINKDISCPNCGAPISNTASSKCEYCGSDIVKDSSEFVLSKKTNVNK